MNSQSDDAKRLRIRDLELIDRSRQPSPGPCPGMPCLVTKTTVIASYPTVASSYFACSPLTVLGQEVEGGTGVLSSGPSTFLALNLGTAIPPVGASVLVTFVDNRWVFRYDG